MKIRKMLIDMDGVIYQGDHAIEGAHEALKYLKEQGIDYALVTNTARMCRDKIVEKVEKFGFDVDLSKFMTSPLATIDHIKSKKPGAKCYVIIPNDLDSDFKNAGLNITRKEEPVDFVVLGYRLDMTYEMMDIAFRLLRDGAELVAMHEDTIFPGNVKHIGLGGFVRALEYTAAVDATVVGKPSKKFFELGMAKINANPEETAMIGDGLRGDIIGAKNSGLTAILVKTGGYNENEVKKSKIKPDYVIGSINDLPNLLKELGKGEE